MNCEEYIQFVTKTIKRCIDDQHAVMGRNLDDPTGIYAKKKIEVLEELANMLGVEI